MPEAALYLSDAYQGYDRLSADRHGVGKDGAVSRSEGAHSGLGEIPTLGEIIVTGWLFVGHLPSR